MILLSGLLNFYYLFISVEDLNEYNGYIIILTSCTFCITINLFETGLGSYLPEKSLLFFFSFSPVLFRLSNLLIPYVNYFFKSHFGLNV